MRELLFVAMGGALGAVARFTIANQVNAIWPLRFPIATFSVNVVGSLLMGVLYVLIAERGIIHPDWRSIAMVGLLGALTTYSTFSLETVHLLENGEFSTAVVYILTSVCCCLSAAWLGMFLARISGSG